MIRIPAVQNKNGASTAQLIAEQIRLCESNLNSIENVAVYNKSRELRDEINRRIRNCHNLLGMVGGRSSGCLYQESGDISGEPVVCEHAIPVSVLVDLYQSSRPLVNIIFYPVALVTKKSDKLLRNHGLVKSGHDFNFIFSRYHQTGICLKTHDGASIDVSIWTMNDHLDLIDRTPELSSMKSEVESILQG